MPTKFQVLAELCDKLEAKSSRTLMVSYLAEFLMRLNHDEVEPAVSMILGRAFPKWDRRALNVSWKTLSGVIKSLSKSDQKRFNEAFGKTGDLGRATQVVFEESKTERQITLVKKPLLILEVRRNLEAIAGASGSGSRERKARLLGILLSEASPIEAKYIVKIITGEMRIGLNEGLMELALSKAFNIPHTMIQKASVFVGGVANVAAIAKIQGKNGISKLQFQIFHPIKPMLSQAASNIKQVLETHGGESAFENKLDGVRVQIHKSKDIIRVFSRRLTDVTQSFPEIVALVQREVGADETILEGEIIAIGENGIPLPFQYLMRRFRRIHNIKRVAGRIPVRLHLFDLVYLNGESLIAKPYLERREKLEKIAGKIPLTEQIITNDHMEANRFLQKAIKKGHEGLVAKKLDSLYTPGTRGKNWLKIKECLDPLDLVIVAAEYGYGRRRSWLSDYYLAARDLERGGFAVVGKTFKGLTDSEIIEITKRLKETTIRKKLRKVDVVPSIVVEVAYNEIQKSPKYECGMALRFARIKRIRNDKSIGEVDTIHRIKTIYAKQFERKAKYSYRSNLPESHITTDASP